MLNTIVLARQKCRGQLDSPLPTPVGTPSRGFVPYPEMALTPVKTHKLHVYNVMPWKTARMNLEFWYVHRINIDIYIYIWCISAFLETTTYIEEILILCKAAKPSFLLGGQISKIDDVKPSAVPRWVVLVFQICGPLLGSSGHFYPTVLLTKLRACRWSYPTPFDSL